MFASNRFLVKSRQFVLRLSSPFARFLKPENQGDGGVTGWIRRDHGAVAAIGGVVISTLFTLLLVPVAYSLLERWLAVRGPKPLPA